MTENQPAPCSPLPWREGKRSGTIVCDEERRVCQSMNPADIAFVLAQINPPVDETKNEDMLARFVALEKRRRGLEAELDATKKESAGVAEMLLDEWADRGQQNARVEDLTVFVSHDFYCNKRAGVPAAQVCDLLDRFGLERLVAPGYSATSLKAWVREQLTAGSDLPVELEAVLSHGETTRLKTRLT